MSESLKNDLKSQVLLRTATEADVSFLFNSWLTSYQSAVAVKNIAAPVYFAEHHKQIENLLKRSVVWIACNKSDNSQIYGYGVFETVESLPVIHYVYVKHIFRKMGLCNMLLAQANLTATSSGFCSHQTEVARRVLEAKKSKLVYNPYLGQNP